MFTFLAVLLGCAVLGYSIFGLATIEMMEKNNGLDPARARKFKTRSWVRSIAVLAFMVYSVVWLNG